MIRGLINKYVTGLGGMDEVAAAFNADKLPGGVRDLLAYDEDGKLVWHLRELTKAGASQAIEALMPLVEAA